jgi:hypothetical protein
MVLQDPDTYAVIRDCCSYGAPAIILNPESGVVCHARFASVSDGSIGFHLLEDVREFPKMKSYLVSFSHGGNCCAFFAAILEYRRIPLTAAPYLSLKITTKIFGVEARMSYRIPIETGSVLILRLFTQDGATLHPRPVDVSLTGILIEFGKIDDPDLALSSVVGLEMQLADQTANLKAVVKRRDGHRYGLFFQEVVTGHGIEPPGSLRTIIDALDRLPLQEIGT